MTSRIWLFLIFSVVLVAGCTSPQPGLTPDEIARANATVQEFLEKYPNAETSMTKFEESAFEAIKNEIQGDCENPTIGPKEYYRIKINDPQSNAEMKVWIDWQKREIVCANRESAQQDQNGPAKETCSVGWKCKSANKKALQKEDCSWEQETECEKECSNGNCIQTGGEAKEDPCEGVTCNDSCQGSTRSYNGHCVNGQCQYSTTQCTRGCENGLCKGDPCEGVLCADQCEGKALKKTGTCVNGQCQYSSSVNCQFGCRDLSCLSDPCEGISCPVSCESNVRKYNGACVDGECQYSTQNCESGCEGTVCAGDPCEGVVCNDQCQGNTLNYSGSCVNGQCQYSTKECNSDLCKDELTIFTEGRCQNARCEYTELACARGCQNNACKDPCEGVVCNNKCQSNIGYFSGQCLNGQCQYQTKQCTYGCDGNFCLEYYCDWGWPQKITNKNTHAVLWSCTDDKPYCGASVLGTPTCCTTANPYTGCVEGSCIGVTCSDHCQGTTRYYSGNCTNGQCQYQTQQCAYGCTSGQCITQGIVFASAGLYQGDFGGLSGADAKCTTIANAAGKTGTWKAILSDSSTNAKDRIPDTVYRRIDGTIVANSKADLFDGTLAIAVNKTESGGALPYHDKTWTASTSTGEKSAANCANWTVKTSVENGGYGNANSTTATWMNSASDFCTNSKHIYCVLVST